LSCFNSNTTIHTVCLENYWKAKCFPSLHRASHTYIRTYMHTYIHRHTYCDTNTCARIRTHIQTYIHTCAHTCNITHVLTCCLCMRLVGKYVGRIPTCNTREDGTGWLESPGGGKKRIQFLGEVKIIVFCHGIN